MKKLKVIALYALYLLLLLIFLHSLYAAVAYGLFGFIAAVGMFSGNDPDAWSTLLLALYAPLAAACMYPALQTLSRLILAKIPPRTAAGRLPVSPLAAVAAYGLYLAVPVATLYLEEMPAMAPFIVGFLLLGGLMLLARRSSR